MAVPVVTRAVTERLAHLVNEVDSVMPPFRVTVAGPEAPAEGTAELWCGDDLLAVTFLYDGRLHLRIEPRADGQQWLIDATGLVLALDEAARRIED